MHAIERDSRNPTAGVGAPQPADSPKYSEAAVTAWLVDRMAAVLEVPPETVDIQQTFDEFGVNSVQAISLTGELADWLGTDVPATLVWEYPTIELVARQVAQRCAGLE
jgi:acyl carrier protein